MKIKRKSCDTDTLTRRSGPIDMSLELSHKKRAEKIVCGLTAPPKISLAAGNRGVEGKA